MEPAGQARCVVRPLWPFLIVPRADPSSRPVAVHEAQRHSLWADRARRANRKRARFSRHVRATAMFLKNITFLKFLCEKRSLLTSDTAWFAQRPGFREAQKSVISGAVALHAGAWIETSRSR